MFREATSYDKAGLVPGMTLPLPIGLIGSLQLLQKRSRDVCLFSKECGGGGRRREWELLMISFFRKAG